VTRRSLVQLAKDAKLVARRRIPEVPGITRDRYHGVPDRVRHYAYSGTFLSHYSLTWVSGLAATLQPLCSRYNEPVLIDDRIKPSFENYR
jgi:hypothetical protein